MRAKDCTVHGFYVIDEMTTDPTKRVVSGPFRDLLSANADMHSYNIAEDCIVVVRDNTGWLTQDEAPNLFRNTYRITEVNDIS